MIPAFPIFKRLELSDARDIEHITASFPPYSDFNFVSLWCWNTVSTCRISRLNGNLVVQLDDYVTSEPLLTFLGSNAISETIAALFAYAAENGMEPRLRLVPAFADPVDRSQEGVSIAEDPGSADYVLSIPEWVALDGSKFREKRKVLRRFERTFDPSFLVLDLRDFAVQREIMQVLGRWIVQRERAGHRETANEALALRRFFTLERNDNLHGFAVYAAGAMQGFLLTEGLGNGYVIGHFWKANLDAAGAYVYLLNRMSQYFAHQGFAYFNIEQDLGKSGLAQSKRLLRPCHYLRKFEIAAAPVILWNPAILSEFGSCSDLAVLVAQ